MKGILSMHVGDDADNLLDCDASTCDCDCDRGGDPCMCDTD